MPPTAPALKTLAWVAISVKGEKAEVGQMTRTSTVDNGTGSNIVPLAVVRLLLESEVLGLTSLPQHEGKISSESFLF